YLGALVAHAARFGIVELEIVEVRNQSSIQHADRSLLAFAESRGAACNAQLRLIDREVIRLAAISITEHKIVVEDEIRAMEEVENQWRVCDGDEARGRRATIGMLAPGVERRRKERAFFPFESLLRAALVPDGCFTFAIEHIDRFFEHIPLRLRVR